VLLSPQPASASSITLNDAAAPPPRVNVDKSTIAIAPVAKKDSRAKDRTHQPAAREGVEGSANSADLQDVKK
jgi:hypothetical protein